MQHSVRSIALASCAVFLFACGGTKTTTKKPKEEPKPEPTKQAAGEQLRFKAKQNERLNAKVALTMEFDVMVKQGKRVAHLRVEAWQSSPDKPIAIGHGNFMLKPVDEPQRSKP